MPGLKPNLEDACSSHPGWRLRRAGLRTHGNSQDSLAIAETVARGPETSADVGEALLRLTQARLAAGARAGTMPLLERAVRCLTNALAPDHPLTVEASNLLVSTAV